MTRKDKGNYGKKHSAEVKLNPAIAEAVKKELSEGKLSCAGAFKIAAELKVTPGEVGTCLDLLEVRLIKCQMGLFGNGHEGKDIKAAETVSPAVEADVRTSLVQGKLPCRTAWEIGRKLKITKKEIASACEALKIKISPCQLGAF